MDAAGRYTITSLFSGSSAFEDLDVGERVVRIAPGIDEREGRDRLAISGREVLHHPWKLILIGAVDHINGRAAQRWVRLDLSLQVTGEGLVALYKKQKCGECLKRARSAGERPTYASSMMSGEPRLSSR